MIAAILSGIAAASGNYADALPGTMFPIFNTTEHCRVMATSLTPKVAYSSKGCLARETEHKEMASGSWLGAVDSDRTMCEIHALDAIGSYAVLASCLNAQTSIRILLKMPLRNEK